MDADRERESERACGNTVIVCCFCSTTQRNTTRIVLCWPLADQHNTLYAYEFQWMCVRVCAFLSLFSTPMGAKGFLSLVCRRGERERRRRGERERERERERGRERERERERERDVLKETQRERQRGLASHKSVSCICHWDYFPESN